MALRQLAEEARQRLAVLEAQAPERDFYVGVMTAAEDIARSGGVASRPGHRDSPAFRDGYLKVSSLVGAASGHVPHRFPLPVP